MFALRLAVVALAAVSAQATVTVPLKKLVHELINTEYAGEVQIDNQKYLLVFDTTSYNVVVLGAECVGGACQCVNPKRYSNVNGDYSKNIENVVYFDTANATGRSTTADLKIRSLSSPEQGIFVADTASFDICALNVDGVVGVGPPNSGKTAFGQTTVLENFVKQNEIPAIFSVHHGRHPDGEHFGEIIFGGSDLRYTIGNFTYVNLRNDQTWEFKLDYVKLGDENVADDNTYGIVDTSKNIVVGPTAQINKLNEKLKCKNVKINGITLCELDCKDADNAPELAFGIAGRKFNISAEYHIQRIGGLCVSGFVPLDIEHYLIGDFFIDHYYTEYNYEKKAIGLAEAREGL